MVINSSKMLLFACKAGDASRPQRERKRSKALLAAAESGLVAAVGPPFSLQVSIELFI